MGGVTVMKIIDSKKDYYDFYSGLPEYGTDPAVVYDRRNSVPAKKWMDSFPYYFYSNYVGIYDKKDGKPSPLYIYVQHGFNVTAIKVSRTPVYDGDSMSMDLKYSAYSPEDLKSDIVKSRGKYVYGLNRIIERMNGDCKRFSDAPLALRFSAYPYYTVTPGSKDRSVVENPILSGSPLAGLLPAEEIWTDIYDYLLKKNEPDVTDKRDDLQKIADAGFDKKTSFRNM